MLRVLLPERHQPDPGQRGDRGCHRDQVVAVEESRYAEEADHREQPGAPEDQPPLPAIQGEAYPAHPRHQQPDHRQRQQPASLAPQLRIEQPERSDRSVVEEAARPATARPATGPQCGAGTSCARRCRARAAARCLRGTGAPCPRRGSGLDTLASTRAALPDGRHSLVGPVRRDPAAAAGRCSRSPDRSPSWSSWNQPRGAGWPG